MTHWFFVGYHCFLNKNKTRVSGAWCLTFTNGLHGIKFRKSVRRLRKHTKHHVVTEPMHPEHISHIQNQLIHFWKFLLFHRHEVLLVCILCAALLLRLDSFHDNHYSYQSDYNRDYLVAHHIVAYHEFPLTGPDGEFGSAGNSPAYFYLLTLPLLLKDETGNSSPVSHERIADMAVAGIYANFNE